ncbi:MAG: hypothetical protein LPK19_16920, partial [Hymenobacteraceae bacterium]|nr:hypothetical protein [Hymenobacteraceae bacterium]MDX5397938.1 hypothetical protein [Hymenobacteraceae bacterium]MDX5514007.1 hypothetical protein [Hymenobacteraceae bacterium]
MQNHLLYQAYGKTEILHELIYSIYSLLKVYDGKLPFQVTVYTDNVPLLQKWLPLEVQYRQLRPEEIQQWKGEHDFVHRVKIMMIRDFISSRSGNLLYLDTDTVFTTTIDHLFAKIEQGVYVMHENEGKISSKKNPIFQKLFRFLSENQVGIPTDTTMVNAGVLGLKCSDTALVDAVLKSTDQMYALYQKHIIEQLAFSYQMGKKEVYCATEEVFHYWNFKEFRAVLQEFFTFYDEQQYQHLLSKIELIDPRKL